MLGADMLQMMQPAAQCHAGQGETGELQQQPQRLQSQQATLFPPSYFKEAATSPQTEAVPVGDEHTGKAASAPVLKPRDDGRPLNQREAVEGREEQTHLATLRLQNQALRAEWQALQSVPSTLLPASHPPYLGQNTSPGILTSDLVQVECELQSRLGRAEAESRRLAGRLQTLENALREERESHDRDREALTCQHRTAMEQVTREKREVEERWREEGEEWRERMGRVEEREREREEEISRTQERLAQVEQEKSGLMSELEREREDHREQVTSLHSELNTAEEQIGSLQSELQGARGRVDQLESFLGGELPETGSGVTWKEERGALLAHINASEEDGGRLRSEAQLMAVRLSAISEILTLHEARLTQGLNGSVVKEPVREVGGGKGGMMPHLEEGQLRSGGEEERVRVGGGRMGVGGLKGVLSLWREKVFALLVQTRLQQMQHDRETHEAQSREAGVLAQVSEAVKERDLLSHTLTDRTAQLQLQISKTEEMESQLRQMELALRERQSETERLGSLLQHVTASVRGSGETCSRLKSCVDGCLSRLANYEQRVGVVTRRVASLSATLGSQLTLQGVSGKGQRSEVSTQTETPEKAQELSRLSQSQLVEEVVTLLRERDGLAEQLSRSTAALQQLRNTASATQSALEQTCSTLHSDNTSLNQQLEEVGAELARHREMETGLRAMQASLQSRVDSAVMEERRKSRHELSEAQSLLEVARREHSKTVLQLQQTERKLHCERDSAVEAVEVSRQAVEEELQRCRDRLRAVQVERNLLLTTLRQEGIKVPARRPAPRLAVTPQDMTSANTREHTTTGQELSIATSMRPYTPTNLTKRLTPSTVTCSSSDGSSHSPSPSPSPECSDIHEDARSHGTFEGARSEDSDVIQRSETGEVIRRIMTGTPPHPTLASKVRVSSDLHKNKEEDIHCVLKELQVLSTALLEMKPQS